MSPWAVYPLHRLAARFQISCIVRQAIPSVWTRLPFPRLGSCPALPPCFERDTAALTRKKAHAGVSRMENAARTDCFAGCPRRWVSPLAPGCKGAASLQNFDAARKWVDAVNSAVCGLTRLLPPVLDHWHHCIRASSAGHTRAGELSKTAFRVAESILVSVGAIDRAPCVCDASANSYSSIITFHVSGGFVGLA